MKQHTEGYSPFAAIIVLLVTVLVLIPFYVQARTVMPIYELRFNPFALLSMLGVMANAIIIALLFRRQKKTFDSLWLIAASASIFLFAAAEAMQRLSASPTTAVFWAQLGGIGVSFAAAFYFLFAVNYTNPEKPNALLTTSVILGAALISFFHANGGLIFKTDPGSVHLYAWGYNNDVGPAFIANLLWFALLASIAVVLTLRYRHRSNNKFIRSQAAIFSIGLATPVLGGILFDSLFPVLGIEVLPPMGGALFTVTGILMVIGVRKYRVFELSPTILSQNILTTMSEAVVVTNNELSIEYVNAEAEKLFGGDSAELSSQPLSDLFNNNQQLKALRDSILNGDTLGVIEPIEDMTLGTGQETRYLRILSSPISRNRQIEGFIFVISDITQLQHAYFELEAAKTSVERIVEERTHELRQAQNKLLETDKLKSEFIMLASHNLRTPLTIIEGYVDLLEQSNLDGTQKLALANLHTSSKRLGNLINELLTISTIEAGDQPMDKKPVSARETLERIFQEAGTLAGTTTNTYSTSVDVGTAQILANPDRLGAALNNIVDNAFKFTENGTITCSAKLNQDQLVITIEDTGVGIKAQEQSKLFTKFHRGSDTLQYDYEGQGLGLYLAKLIISEHQGTISVDSVENKGTTVTVTLPFVSQEVETPDGQVETVTSQPE